MPTISTVRACVDKLIAAGLDLPPNATAAGVARGWATALRRVGDDDLEEGVDRWLDVGPARWPKVAELLGDGPRRAA